MNTNPNEPFLPPINNPKDWRMKILYFFTRRSFGKVLSPMSIHSARLPFAFFLSYTKPYSLEKKLKISAELVLLIRERVARINGCSFCMDAHRWAIVQKKHMNEAKFNSIDEYQTSSHFSDAEKAVMDYVGELTKNRKIDPQTFNRMAKYYSEREICEIVWVAANENFVNLTNIGLNIHSDMLCEIKPKNKQK